MDRYLKVLVSILIISCMGLLVSSVALFFMRQSELEKRMGLESKVITLNRERTKLSKELGDVVLAKKDLEVEISSLEDKAGRLEAELIDEKKERELVTAQLDQERKEAKQLIGQLMQAKTENEQVSSSLTDINNTCIMLKTQLDSIQKAKEILEAKFKDTLTRRGEVELEKIVIKPDDTGLVAETYKTVTDEEESTIETKDYGPKGEVLVVNKKFDFVVVSLGENNGIENGMDLEVYRDEQFLAALKVEKVHTNMSAAKIPPEWKKADIREGDIVVVVR